ncbi:MAG: FkbM family methyltransferase [Candidatus Accumulibacter propinquus]|jgi:hypothetical protein
MKITGFPRQVLIAVLTRLDLYSSVLLRRQGPLFEDGWFRSFREQRPVNAAGHPIPWLTYPALDFLVSRLDPSLSVFEYSCGHSTLWWAGKVQRIVAVEHDPAWVAEIQNRLPTNATIRRIPLDPEAGYVDAITAEPGPFDVVVVDGRHRNQCLQRVPEALSPRGVIILDNSERPQYQTGMEYLKSLGFRHVDFSGLVPIVCWKSCTSVFYRDGNFLGM